MNTIQVKDLSFSYLNFALKKISFSLNKKDICAILGPNGAGKSTLLKCLASVLRPQIGSIVINGTDIAYFRRKKYSSLVSYIPQTINIFQPFKVIDIVVSGVNPQLKFFQYPSQQHYKKAFELLDEFNLTYLANRHMNEISGGELQLAFFLRALMTDSIIFLLDEPTAFLDFKNQSLVLSTIIKIAKEKEKTILVSLHDPNQVSLIANLVLLLKDGVMLDFGDSNSILMEDNLSKLYNMRIKTINSDKGKFFMHQFDFIDYEKE
ncbi:MAG: ABC transporter ATP-binding protein [Spirochaetes bacterium]|nr:ABC transporter ATP-binding protein [Spirochaetota bacterium]MBP8990755.1 ABC transporter ATP-binding protein [Spirochaetota bacterium]HOV46441.1 ABC transporter ATP-binding protein [Exilispira sp.]